MLIESNQNPMFKNWMKLKQKKYRNQFQEFLVEGEHLVLEAVAAGVVKEIILREGADFHTDAALPVTYMKEALFNRLATTETPQPIMAVCEMRKQSIEKRGRILLLDRVQDPGNLGTLIRSAVAFGFDGAILGEGCVDVYNEKVIRSTQGAIFHLKIEHQSLSIAVDELQANGVKVFGTSLENGRALKEIEPSDHMAFILGNEGQGVQQALLEKTNQNIFIEMSKNIESLNVSIAGSIIMYNFCS